jgi:hypothetical protein
MEPLYVPKHYKGFLPWITRMRIMIMAITRRMWMNQPMANTPIMPRNQRIKRITAIVKSIFIGAKC